MGPADGATGQPANLLFTWDPVAGASTYQVEVTGVNVDVPAFATSVVETSARIPYTANVVPTSSPYKLPFGTYTWRVRAANEGGLGAWSSPHTFVIGAPPVPAGGFQNFLTTRNGAGPLDPPDYGAPRGQQPRFSARPRYHLQRHPGRRT